MENRICRLIKFYDEKGKYKLEEMCGKDENQLEALCDQLAEFLSNIWLSKVKWMVVENDG